MVDSDNEGIRTHTLKFLEEVVLLQSPSDREPSDDDLSLAVVPLHITFINRRSLEQEAQSVPLTFIFTHNIILK